MDAPDAGGAVHGLQEALTRKIGPLPGYVWALGAGGLLALYLHSRGGGGGGGAGTVDPLSLVPAGTVGADAGGGGGFAADGYSTGSLTDLPVFVDAIPAGDTSPASSSSPALDVSSLDTLTPAALTRGYGGGANTFGDSTRPSYELADGTVVQPITYASIGVVPDAIPAGGKPALSPLATVTRITPAQLPAVPQVVQSFTGYTDASSSGPNYGTTTGRRALSDAGVDVLDVPDAPYSPPLEITTHETGLVGGKIETVAGNLAT